MKVLPDEGGQFEAGGLEDQEEGNPLVIADAPILALLHADVHNGLLGLVKLHVVGVGRVAIILGIIGPGGGEPNLTGRMNAF
jgi:hypothetical protein